MDLIEALAADMGKRPGDISIKDLMDNGVDPVVAMRAVSDRAEKQSKGQAPSAPSTTPPGWSWTPTPTQPAIDLGKKVTPEIPVPTYQPLPDTSQRQATPSKPSGSRPAGTSPPPSASVPAPPSTPTAPQLPQLDLGSPGGNNLLLWFGLGFLLLLVVGRR